MDLYLVFDEIDNICYLNAITRTLEEAKKEFCETYFSATLLTFAPEEHQEYLNNIKEIDIKEVFRIEESGIYKTKI